MACITEQVSTLVNKRIISLYYQFDETINRYKHDVPKPHSGKKGPRWNTRPDQWDCAAAVQGEYRGLCPVWPSEQGEAGCTGQELVLQLAVEAEQLVVGKLKKDIYIEDQKVMSGKWRELVTKIDYILDAL